MSGFLYRGRDYGGNRQDRPKSVGHMTDSCRDDAESGPSLQMHSLREFEQHLNDLKKENFSLKLRIYFLEERIQQKYEESSDDVHRRNIELKVEVESLKQELQERQQLLDQAVSTAESLSNQNETELQHRCDARQQEISHMQEVLETKVQLLQEEAQLARGEAEKMASLADSESKRCLALEREMVVKMEECGGSLGPWGHEALADKGRGIDELNQSLSQRTDEKSSLRHQVTELEFRVHALSSSLQEKDRDLELLRTDQSRENGHVQQEMQKLIDEQQSQLGQYESAAGHCVSELQKAQLQVQSLQAKIRESDTRNQKLQVRLGEMECELRGAREEAQRQERDILTLNDSVSTKEMEAAEFYRVIEEQNNMLSSLKELANRNQLTQLQVSGAESVRGQGEVLALQGSLFRAQLELQASQRAQRQATRREEDSCRALQRLEHDLQGALEHRRITERHNQDLQMALEKARGELQERQEQLLEKEGDRLREEEEREKTIRELRTSLQTKDQLVQDYSELLEQQQDPGEKRDSMLCKLRERIKERDRALERAVDEKFRCVEEKEGEVRRLQLLLREKERDLERQRCVLSNNEETITSLEVLLRGKGLELEQVSEAWRSVQRHLQDSEERQGRTLRERDALTAQLQTALHTRTKEAEDLTSALLGKIQVGPNEALQELNARLQLKDRLFQELLSDRSQQAQEHQAQIQDLLSTISTRDQYIKDSAGRLGEVMCEQTSRLQELRRQLTSSSQACVSGGGAGLELQALQEELRLALRREREAQEDSRSQAAQLEALATTIHVKEEIIKDFQMQLVDPSSLPLVERLTQQLQEMRQSLALQEPATPRQAAQARPAQWQTDHGDLTSEEEDEDDVISEYADSIEDEDTKLTAQALSNMQNPDQCGGPRKGELSQDASGKGPGLVEVKQLVEQKRVVERELGELKAQLEKAGFSSLSQMRKAFFSLRAENEDLKSHQPLARLPVGDQREEQKVLEEEEEDEEVDLDLDLEEEEEEEDEGGLSEQWEAHAELCPPQGKRCSPLTQMRDSQGKRRGTRPLSLDLRALLVHSEQEDDLETEIAAGRQQRALDSVMCEKAVRLQQESKELQERLMVSEATVQAQAEQLKDYRELLTETSVQQDSKQIQVDLQDLGYETCGRSENEAEREDTSSPEFDDLEMCTSLDCGSQWWRGPVSHDKAVGVDEDASSLQRLVEDLRSQLTRSQTVIRGLQSRLRSVSTSSDFGPSTPRKVNWGTQASPSQSGLEEDEGWQSSDGGVVPSPRHPQADRDLRELVTRVGALEDQLRKERGHQGPPEESKAGKFDTLIQAQARELSHLRQRMREGRGVCHILTQHLGDTTKAFEELLRANDIDYYMGQSFRDQLAQSSALAQRVSTKISGRDHPEVPDDKTGNELLAIRLSKELQQKDKVIESLRSKLHQHQPCSDTPSSSLALSETTDQSDRISFVSDEQGSTNEDLELCSDMDATSECGLEERHTSQASADSLSHRASLSRHPSIPPSTTLSHGPPSSIGCPSMHCNPHKPGDTQSHSGFLMPQNKSYQGFAPMPPNAQADPASFLPQSYSTYHQSPLGGTTASLNASPARNSGASLLERSALWEMTYGTPPMRAGADLSSGSSGYQSGTSNTGSELMKEHLREIRSLRQRLEDSIQTNDRLRQQLEERLASVAREKGAPTNIYIQGLDSVSQLSNEIRALKDENLNLQGHLKQASREGSKEAEQLREAVLLGRARLKEAELETERWAEQSRRLQTHTQAQTQEITQLKQERSNNLEANERLQQEVQVLQKQLGESLGLVHSLQGELQMYHREYGVSRNTHPGLLGKDSHSADSVTFDPRDLHAQLEQRLTRGLGQGETHAHAKRQLFNEQVTSPPVRDTGLLSPTSPLSPTLGPEKTTHKDSGLVGHAPDGSFSNRHGRHVVGHVNDFTALQQQILKGGVLIHKMEAALQSSSPCHDPLELRLNKGSGPGVLRNVQASTKTLRHVLEEAASLLKMFWRAALPSGEGGGPSARKEQALREEVSGLRLRISEQEEALRDAMERLRSSDRTKDSMEHFIVSQLSRTRDVLKKAKTNLQERTSEAAVSSPPLLLGVS